MKNFEGVVRNGFQASQRHEEAFAFPGRPRISTIPLGGLGQHDAARAAVQTKEKLSMAKVYRPGQPAPKSGIFDMVGPRGGRTGEQVVSTVSKPLPPTQRPGHGYTISKPAHHQGRKP